MSPFPPMTTIVMSNLLVPTSTWHELAERVLLQVERLLDFVQLLSMHRDEKPAQHVSQDVAAGGDSKSASVRNESAHPRKCEQQEFNLSCRHTRWRKSIASPHD